jgi:Ca2+-binding RTX toxin-like protein
MRVGVWKLTEAGVSDTGFGRDGISYIAEPGGLPFVSPTVDGKYAVAFRSGSTLAVFKLTPTGGIDPSWGGEGGFRRYSSISPFDTSDLVLGTDGNLLAGGSYGGGTGVARLLDSIPEIDLTGGTALEGKILPFAATLNKTSGFPVSFDFTTGEGSAASGRDYFGRTGGLTIPAGLTAAVIPVATRLDHLFETDESFRVELANVTGARTGDLLANGTIINVLRTGRCQNIVDGHKGTDILTGSSAGDRIIGRNDVDYLYGFDGADCIYGQRGGDYIDGGGGNDVIDGGSGNDQLKGGTGNDRIYGRSGRNRYNGGPGNDVIDSRNAVAEVVECGSGRDTVRGDVRDVLRHCERFIR